MSEIHGENTLDKINADLLDQMITKQIQTYFICLIGQMGVDGLNSYEELRKVIDNDQAKDQIAETIVADLIVSIKFSLSTIANSKPENPEASKENLLDRAITAEIQKYFISLVQQMLDSDLTVDQIAEKFLKIQQELWRIQKNGKDKIVKKIINYLTGVLEFLPK